MSTASPTHDIQSESLGHAQDRAIKRMAHADFTLDDLIESLKGLDPLQWEGLQEAIRDSDHLQVGRIVDNALFHWLTEWEMENT